MPRSKNNSILVDQAHGNMIQPEDPEFKPLFTFIQSKNYDLDFIETSKFSFENLQDHQMLFIGVPQSAYFLQDEINNILNFVRKGGGLFLIHRYGGDLIQKTDLNELSTHFDITFENTIVKDTLQLNIASIPFVNPTQLHPILKNVHKLIFPGSCSLKIDQNAHSLLNSSESSWVELFNPHSFDWIRQESTGSYPICAYRSYGQGRVIAIGSADFLSNHPSYGLEALDHKRFVQNCLTWLTQPVSEAEVKEWMVEQLGSLSKQISVLQNSTTRIQTSFERLEHRVADLEHKYYASKGIHIPISEEENKVMTTQQVLGNLEIQPKIPPKDEKQIQD
jgi:hypothetical protein